jgi:hypothetical protein
MTDTQQLIISAFAFLLTFLIYRRNENLAIAICLFMLPYNVISYRSIGLNAFLISGLFIGAIIKRKTIEVPFKGFFYCFAILLFISAFLPSLKNYEFDRRIDFDENFSLESINRNVIKYTVYFYLGYRLILMIIDNTKNIKNLLYFITSFNLCTLYFFIPYVGSYQYHLNLPTFINELDSTGNTIHGFANARRFSGFWGDYELTNELMFIVASLSFFVFINPHVTKKQKIFSLITGILAIIMALGTGTRSLIIMFAILAFLYMSMQFSFTKISIFKKITLLTLPILMYLGFNYLVVNSTIQVFNRFSDISQSYEAASSSNTAFDNLMERNYSQTYMDILEIGGLYGTGLIVIYSINGYNTVFHCLYYQLILNFGILGLIATLILIFQIGIRLLSQILKFKNSSHMLMLSLFVSLLTDQFKINLLRQSSHILTFLFLIAIMIVLIFKWEVISNATQNELLENTQGLT